MKRGWNCNVYTCKIHIKNKKEKKRTETKRKDKNKQTNKGRTKKNNVWYSILKKFRLNSSLAMPFTRSDRNYYINKKQNENCVKRERLHKVHSVNTEFKSLAKR